MKTSELRYTVGASPLGVVLLAGSDRGIRAIFFGNTSKPLLRDLRKRFPKELLIEDSRTLAPWLTQVIHHIQAPHIPQKLPLDLQGTDFQQRVWKELQKIPCAQTRTYSQIARAIGKPRATRAVAGACGRNPISVLVPCHRVIAQDGSLAGYHWGTARKSKLLDMERKTRLRSIPSQTL